MPSTTRLTLLICLGLAICRAGAEAGKFQITPLRVFLSPSAKNANVSIKNEAGEAVRFQVTAFAWDEDPRGEMKLTPTKEVVFFPALLQIPPNGTKNLRVGLTTGFGAKEKTYRVFITEMPAVQKGKDGLTQEAGVKVLMRWGIPVFAEAAQKNSEAVIEQTGVSRGRLRFVVRNPGNTHFLMKEAVLTGKKADGTAAFEKKVPGWYVLGGGSREYDVELPADSCRNARTINIAVITDQPQANATVSVDPNACAP